MNQKSTKSSIARLAILNFVNHESVPGNIKDNAVIARTQAIGRRRISFQFDDAQAPERMRELARIFDSVKDLDLEAFRQTSRVLGRRWCKTVGKHAYTPNSLRNLRPSTYLPFDEARSSSMRATTFGLAYSIRSTISSSISFDTREDGATIPRKFLSSIMVMADVLIRASIPNRAFPSRYAHFPTAAPIISSPASL